MMNIILNMSALRLVNSSKSSLNISFTDIPYRDNSSANKKYYDNAMLYKSQS